MAKWYLHMDKLSRREMLKILGVIGGGIVTCSAASVGGLLYYRASRSNNVTEMVASSTVPMPTIIPREGWGAYEPNHIARYETGFYDADTNPLGWRIYEGNLADNYQTLVLHHTAFYSNNDQQTIQEVQSLHRNRGWADIGYHFLVGQSGNIFAGRNWQVRGTHVAGYNTGSMGICLLGNFMETSPTPPQIDSARQLVLWLAETLQLTHIAGHRNFNDETLCPGDTLVPYIADFAGAATLAIGIEGYISPDEQQAIDEETSLCACCDCTRV